MTDEDESTSRQVKITDMGNHLTTASSHLTQRSDKARPQNPPPTSQKQKPKATVKQIQANNCAEIYLVSQSNVTQVKKMKQVAVVKNEKAGGHSTKENKHKHSSNSKEYPMLKKKHIKDSKFNFDMAHILQEAKNL